jgi:hypothetical protein
MDRHVVSGKDRRQSDLLRVRSCSPAGLLRARRSIRELVPADLGHPGGAARLAGNSRRVARARFG